MTIDVDKLVLAIAERFKEHGMQRHLASLRAYYADRRRRARARMKLKEQPWDEGLVLEWAALWRIPPLDTVYLRLEKGLPCPCGKGTPANTHTAVVFPEGHVTCCGGCGASWLVLNLSAC